jgi:hypothetical protein
MQTNLAPVCLFVYNRLEETKQTIKALQNNFLAPKSHLYIFSDGSKNENSRSKVQAIRNYIHSIKGFKNVHVFESKTNKGLATSIIDGVTKIINEYNNVIVLEDDLITTPNFLNFMNQALEFYEFDKKIKSVNGFSLDIKSKIDSVYFQTRPFPWGWATWKDRWNQQIFDKKRISDELETDKLILKKFNKKCGDDMSKMLLNSLNEINDSWYVRWTYSHFINNKISVYPSRSFIENIGFSADSTHCGPIDSYKYKLEVRQNINLSLIDFDSINLKEEKNFLKYFTISYKLLFRLKLLLTLKGFKLVLKELKFKIK